ncbi:MAG: sigma-70 family RNA polymerase sigma factor [Anaerolineae bacterium]
MGQADDYADLYRDYLPRILNYVRLRVGDEALAHDLTAAVFERVIAKQHTLRKREAFGPWIFRIARNEIAGHYRRRRQTLSLELVDEQSSSEPTPPEVVLRREQLARLTSALATLSEREQEIIRLKFGAGLRNQEIAKVMRLRAGHVAVILYRALRKLRGQLDAD